MQNKKNQSQKVVPPFLNRVGVEGLGGTVLPRPPLSAPPPGPYYTPLVG